MGQLVQPKVHWVGFTEINEEGLDRYLRESGNEEFRRLIDDARTKGISSAEILCSMFAKLCYRSLSEGKNSNITRTRSIEGNLRGCFDAGHGSVFEHVGFNFIVTDCSRVFTHELVRHRIGTAFSQTSGRYCRLDSIDLVWDPILEPAKEVIMGALGQIEDAVYLAECKLGLRKPNPLRPAFSAHSCLHDLPFSPAEREARRWVPIGEGEMDFTRKKQLTSAIRRIAPNGQSNEIAFSVNLRALRHTVMMRTGRHSEREIRLVFAQIHGLLKDKFPTIFHGARETVVDGIVEVSGMKMQPYEQGADELLAQLTDDQLEAELARRRTDKEQPR